jgi:hypothetical protein
MAIPSSKFYNPSFTDFGDLFQDQQVQQQPQFTPAPTPPPSNPDMNGFQKFYQDYGLNPLAAEIQGMFDTKPNEQRIDRTKQVARVNALGNAMRVLADVLTPLMNGGNDNMIIPQHDQTQVRNSLDKYQAELDALDQKKDRYRAMMLNNKVEALDLYMGMQREEANKLWQAQEADRQLQNKFGMEKSMAGIQHGYDVENNKTRFGNEYFLQRERLIAQKDISTEDNKMRWNISQAELAQRDKEAELDALAAQGKLDEKAFTFAVTGSKGNRVKVRDDQRNNIIVELKKLYNDEKNLPLNQKTVADYDNIALLNTSMDGAAKKEVEDKLVAQYWNKFYDETPDGYLVKKDEMGQYIKLVTGGQMKPEDQAATIKAMYDKWGESAVQEALKPYMKGDDEVDAQQTQTQTQTQTQQPVSQQQVKTNPFNLDSYQISSIEGFNDDGTPIINQKKVNDLKSADNSKKITAITEKIKDKEYRLKLQKRLFTEVRANSDKKKVLSNIEQLSQELMSLREELKQYK